MDLVFHIAWQCYERGHDRMGRATLHSWFAAQLSESFPEIFPPSPSYRVGLRRWRI